MSMNVNGSTQQMGTEWFQNMKTQNPSEKAPAAQPPQSDKAVNVTLSREGLESLKNSSKTRTYEGVVKQKESIRQASKSIGASYGYRLSEEAGKLKAQRDSSTAYGLSDKTADYVKAYGNLYDEIVQGYQNGTRERYVEDETSETGYRKMTMEEELNGLDKAFQKAADEADVKEMITNEFQRLSSKAGSKQTSFADTNKKPQSTDAEETIGQKMKKLAQVWKDNYKTSNSKDSSMEKVLSMLNDMFQISKEA
ncbi:MAG: hypothetical protein K2N15_00900 [Lachnospiraceae bacterium]|nr:hypothetical protein [Lachnospiraceae bacterium]